MNREDESQRPSNIPENDPSKGMDSQREVESSPDPKTDQDFPGYPHYPAKEDIMNQRTGIHRVDAEIENMGTDSNASGVHQRFMDGKDQQKEKQPVSSDSSDGADDLQDNLDIKMGTDADVNNDDLAALNSTDAEIGTPQNVSNEDLDTDLDIPGSDLDDDNELIGEEDEENNYYSLGGDRHESQEEDPQSGPDRAI